MSAKEPDERFDGFLKLIGKNIRMEREKAMLTQEQMAELNGIDYKYYQKIEYGEVNITIRTLYKICEKLKIHPKQILDAHLD
ncbi:MAG: helix-turn-helix domain-containing protein [Spirochaetota bacterium]|jgi:transcriptional regulator with XRE-family HTH domain